MSPSLLPFVPRSRCALVAALAAFWSLAPGSAAADDYAETWRRWQHLLTSAQSYANPYLDHTLSVTFTGPTGETHQARGYWDGDDRFVIRFMFPSAGIWSWSTSFSDPADTGLHGQTGQVLVFGYTGENPLYSKGALGVASDGRRLLHADGTPFLLLGDIAWLAYIRATDNEWLDYLDDRAARGFNAVVISVGAKDQGSENPEGHHPFAGNRWSNSFWRNVDEMIQAANDRGIVVVACGLAISTAFDDEAESLAFARGFAARVAGNHVILSPRQDWGSGDGPASANDSALEAAGSAPLQLITQHLSRRPMPEHGLEFHAQAYLDFASVQTNKGEPRDEAPTTFEEASRAQLEWVDALYQAVPTKPVVVLEGIHENEVDQTLLRREMLRRQAYMSFLRGAVGYASSAFGVWTWGEGAGFRPEWGDQALDDALALPWNDAFEHLAGLLAVVDVSSLIPYAESTLVLNQAADFEHRMLVAKRANGRLAMAYLPDNDRIQLDMGAFPTTMGAHWFQPTTGLWLPISSPISNIGPRTFSKPAGWADAVLVLRAADPVPGVGSLLPVGILMALVARRSLRRRAA